MKLNISLLFVVCLSVAFSGCSFSALHGALAGEQERTAQLSKVLTDFHNAIYWGRPAEALVVVVPEARAEFERQAKLRGKDKEKLVDFDIENVHMQDGGAEAEVIVSTRYFRVPTYVVETRRQKEFWGYRAFDGGWHYFGVSAVDDEKQAANSRAEGISK